MKKLLLSLLITALSSLSYAQTTIAGYVAPSNGYAYNPAGVATSLQTDVDGNLLLGAMGGGTPQTLSGYVPPVLLGGQNPDGVWTALQVDVNGNLMTTGSSGSGITALTGDVLATGPGSSAATVVGANGALIPLGLNVLGTNASGQLVAGTLPTGPGQQYIAPQAIAGCGVEYVTGLTYTVGACTYSINGVTYNSPLSNITLPTADPSNPEIDVIFVDTTGVVQDLQGTPGATPQQPTVDPSTQLALTFVLVPTASTTPGNTTLVDIYLEGSEWTGATGGTNSARVNLTSTSNPYSGTHDTEFGTSGTVATTTYAQYTDPGAATVNMSNYNALVFYMRNKAAWPATRSVTVQWYNGATAKGTPVVISSGAYGFNSTTNTTTYQQISIPTSTFGIAGIPVTTLRFTVSGTGTALTGFYLDQVTLQGGNGGVVLPSTLMNFKGPWSATATYSPNDTVTSGGIGYVALLANTNVAVSTAVDWAPVGNAGTVTAVSVATANGVSGTSSGGATPALTLSLGAITPSSIVATGIVDGLAPVTINATASFTFGGGTYQSGYTISNDGTTAVTGTLPVAAAGKQYCVRNIATATSTLTIQTSATGQFIDNAGAYSATGGYVISGGALADAACVVGIDSTHWELYIQSGTWTTH